MGRHRTAEEKAALKERAAALRAAGVGAQRIARELGIGQVLCRELLADVPKPASLARPNAKDEHHEAALALRREGRTYDDIRLELVAVTAYWCEGSKSKPWRRQERLHFINSDPDLVMLWVTWLRSRGVEIKDCRLSVNIHVTADVEAATAYWADLLEVDRAIFAKPVLKRHNPKAVRKNTGVSYVGCLAITTRQSRRLYQDVEGQWQGIARALSSHRSRVA